MSEVQAWRFLVSRNQFLDYRTVVAPDFMCQDNIASLLAKTAEGDPISDDMAYYREIYGSKSGDLTIIYRVREAQAKEINDNAEGILKDSFGREIYFIEGIVLKGVQASLVITIENLEFNHQQLVDDYRDFWEWVSPQPAIPSESTILKLSEGSSLQYRQIPEYIVSRDKSQAFTEFSQEISPKKFEMDGEVSSIVFYTDSIVIARLEGTITQIDINSSKEIDLIKERKLIGGNASPLTVNRAKKLLATCLIEGYDQNIIRVWNIHPDFTKPQSRKIGGEDDIGGFKRVYAINFSSNGEIIASGGNSKLIKLWDVEGGGKRGELAWHTSDIKCIEASPLDNIFASGDEQGFVRIWNWKTLKRLGSVPSHSSRVNGIAFSPRQKVLVTGGEDGKIKIVSYKNDIEDQGLLGEYSDWIGGVNTLAFSPDGEIVASGGDDGKVKLWNVKNKTQIREFSGHDKSVMSVSFSPNGKLLASGGKDYTLRIWQLS